MYGLAANFRLSTTPGARIEHSQNIVVDSNIGAYEVVQRVDAVHVGGSVL